MYTKEFIHRQSHSITVWYQQWLETIRGSVEETTLAQYQHCLTRYIFPYFEDASLESLNEDSIQFFYNSLGRSGKNLSAQTIHLIKIVLHQGLDYAVNNCVLSYNPSDLAYTAKRYYNRSEILSSEIIRHILHKDFHNTYPSSGIFDLLADEKEKQQADCRLHNHIWDESSYIFKKADRNSFRIEANAEFHAIMDMIGCSDLRPHDLRHTGARLKLKETGDLWAVRDLLRHTRLATTIEYLYSTAEDLQEGIEKLDEWYRQFLMSANF